MKNKVDLSIIMVTYNHYEFIQKAIESILCQETHYIFELCIGDDASTDGTAQIVREYAEKYPVCIRAVLHSQNIGATRNSYDLLRTARGRYIAFCDGDDFWLARDRIERQVSFLDAHPVFAGICGRCRVIDENDIEIEPEKSVNFWSFNKKCYSLQDFEKWIMPGHISAFMAKNVFENGNGKLLCKAHDIVGDRTIVFLTLEEGDIYCSVDVESCYRYRRHGLNFMSQYQRKNLRYEDFRMMNMLETYAGRKNMKLSLSNIKKERFAGAVVMMMKSPTLRNREVVYKIFVSSKEKVKYLYILLKVSLLKVLYWNLFHTDKKIKV